MFKKIFCTAASVIRRMNQWWDKDEDKAIASVVAGLIILIGIAVLNKVVLFIIALVLVSNRVLHRCNFWTLCECDLSQDPVNSSVEFDETIETIVSDNEESEK